MNHKIYFYKYCENVVNPLYSKAIKVFYLAPGSLYVQTTISMPPVFTTAQTTWNIKCNHNNGVEYKKE
jgi:hypothetical protein